MSHSLDANHETLDVLRSFLTENAHILGNLVMEVEQCLQESRPNAKEQAVRVLHAYSLQLTDLSLFFEGEVLEIYPRPVDLVIVVRDVVRMLAARCEEAPCRVSMPPSPIWIRGDSERLFRVFLILAEMVCAHAAYGEHEMFIALERGEGLRITLSNTGPAISEERIALLGSPGHRLHQDLPHEGWALLYAQQVVAAHHGTIQYTQSPAGGLHVQVSFS